jgi:hypothetical protein
MVANNLGQHSLPCRTEDGPIHASPRGKKREDRICEHKQTDLGLKTVDI